MRYLLFSILLIAWCALHSVLISLSVTHYLKKHLGDQFRFYRLLYNLVSIVTLVPLVWYRFSLSSASFFQWPGYLKIVEILLIVIGLFLFLAGAKHYNGLIFFGIQQIKEKNVYDSLSKSGHLNTRGILSAIRHPWYAAAILLFWSRNLDFSILLENIIFTAYLIIGTLLEERKLIVEFGDQYRAYQKTVSMLIPYKWLKRRLGS